MQNNVPATTETFTYVEKLNLKTPAIVDFINFLYNRQSLQAINFQIIGNYYFTV